MEGSGVGAKSHTRSGIHQTGEGGKGDVKLQHVYVVVLAAV